MENIELIWNIALLFGRQTVSVSCGNLQVACAAYLVGFRHHRKLIAMRGKFAAVCCRIWQTGPRNLDRFDACGKLWSLLIAVICAVGWWYSVSGESWPPGLRPGCTNDDQISFQLNWSSSLSRIFATCFATWTAALNRVGAMKTVTKLRTRSNLNSVQAWSSFVQWGLSG